LPPTSRSGLGRRFGLDAQRHFERALERDPQYAIPWANLAVVSAMRNERARVEQCRARAHELGFRRRGFQKVLDDLLSKAALSAT
jgi:predicted Zn-dependent protease